MDRYEIVLIRSGMWRAKHVLTRRPYKIFEISAMDQLQPLWWPQVEVILKVDFADVDRRRRPPKESSAFVVVVRISSFLGKRRGRSRRGRRRNGSTTRISWGNRRGSFLVVVRKKGFAVAVGLAAQQNYNIPEHRRRGKWSIVWKSGGARYLVS